jgi:hypothetical protein
LIVLVLVVIDIHGLACGPGCSGWFVSSRNRIVHVGDDVVKSGL